MIGLPLADAVVRPSRVTPATTAGPPEDLAEQLAWDRQGPPGHGRPVPAARSPRPGPGTHDDPSHELALESIQRQRRAGRGQGRTPLVAAGQAKGVEVLGDQRLAARLFGAGRDRRRGHRKALGDGFYAVIYPTRHHDVSDPSAPARRLLADRQYNHQASRPTPATSTPRRTPPTSPPRRVAFDRRRADGGLAGIADYFIAADDLRDVKCCPAVRLGHGRDPAARQRQTARLERSGPLAGTWGNAIAAARSMRVRRLSEDPPRPTPRSPPPGQAYRVACPPRRDIAAAYEMNNLPVVVSGRSQLASMTLDPGSEHQKSAQMIFRESYRLSDLISRLRMFADPPVADRKPADLTAAAERGDQGPQSREQAASEVRHRPAGARRDAAVEVDAADRSGRDRAAVQRVQAEPKSAVLVKVVVDPPFAETGNDASGEHSADGTFVPISEDEQTEAVGRTLHIQVTDDGEGMDDHTLGHALDPFFSAKSAGRQVGMGLPRAAQLARAHGGSIGLRSEAGRGTVATLSIALDSPQ